MGDFAFVTEGVSDHAVLKNIFIGYYKNQREPVITFEQPDPHALLHIGGWTLVSQYLREKKFRQAFQLNSFVVVQVDTDVAQDPGFDVPKQDANGPLSPEALVANVIRRLKVEIGDDDCITYHDRFIFAIGVEQIECWVLPLWFHDARGEQVANCTDRLNNCPKLRDELNAKNYSWISSARKEQRSYDLASREYRKHANIAKGRRNPSLRIFLEDLDARAITLGPLE